MTNICLGHGDEPWTVGLKPLSFALESLSLESKPVGMSLHRNKSSRQVQAVQIHLFTVFDQLHV